MRNPTDRPNILLINCDDLGYGDLGCYGSQVNATPHLDRLAAEGMRFTDFYMASAVCSPSRAAMMTGCYPPRIECGDFDGQAVLFPGGATGLNPGEETIAACLKQAGYATKLVGKWHCGDQKAFLPTRHGFDSYYGLPYSNDMGMQHTRPNCKVPLPLVRDEQVIQEQPDQCALTERYVEECVRFIREKREEPFFLYLAHMHVHLPLLVSERFLKASRNGAYGGAVECIDWATGALMAELRRLGLEENTLVVFTSDNGSRARGEGGSNDPLRGTKGTLWEGGLRVPGIFRWRGQVAAGTTRESIMTSMDLLPTFATLAGAPLPQKTIDGLDFAGLLRGQADAGPRETFFYYWKHNLCAVRHGDWKLAVHRNDWDGDQPVPTLFNLREDIGESRDVYSQNPDRVAKLEKLLEACREDIGDDLQERTGANRRPKGRVDNPVTLTEYDPGHPYMIAAYDGEAG